MEVVRDAVLQEDEVAQIEKVEINSEGKRKIYVSFEGRLPDGTVISMEVDT